METNANILLKKLRVSATITVVLGILSAIAVMLTYLALCDIANHEPNQTLEWYMVGVGLLIWIAFIVSALVSMKFLFDYLNNK
ncbi:MAG: hypothetical protein JNK09_16045 [Prolixibacteraceae bacterium]|nr:hypothetical protein [Prolixibacteraceae bacterium]